MLTVLCIQWGDKYADEYVYRLRDSVARNLRFSHRFVCMTDHVLPGIDTTEPVTNLPGWWQKVGLFAPGVADGLTMFLDLDVVIVGSLDGLVASAVWFPLAMALNFPQSGHGGWQSSVMFWNGYENERRHLVWEDFRPEVMELMHGDQDWITWIVGGAITPIDSGLVVSYKYDCKNGLPPNARIVLFHGKPDPHEVSDDWVIENWRRDRDSGS